MYLVSALQCRRNLFFILLVVMGCLFGGAELAHADQNAYGIIEVGSSGVKAGAWKVVTVSNGEYDVRSIGFITPRNVSTINPSAIPDVANAVSDMIRDLATTYMVQQDKIYVYASSGVTNTPHRSAVELAIQKQTGINIDFLTAEEEATFLFEGTNIYHNRRSAVVSLDIGSGNTKIAYAGHREEKTEVVTLELPVGVKVFAKKVDDERGTRSFVTVASELTSSYLRPMIRDAIQRRPGLMNLDRFYLAGGIVYATATLTHPGESLIRTTDFNPYHQRLSAVDFDQLYQKAVTDADHLFTVDLSGISDKKYRDQVAKNIETIKTNIFSVNQMIAGLEIVRALSDELNLRSPHRTIFFAKDAMNSLMKGYLTSKVLH